MKWDTLKPIIGVASKALGAAVGGPAGAVVGSLIARKLGVPAEPEPVFSALQAKPEAERAAIIREVETTHRAEIDAAMTAVEEVNKTFREEVKSTDQYVRRWRPHFGYIVARAWLVQMLCIAAMVLGAVYLAVTGGDVKAISALFGGAVELLAALVPVWAAALAVLGVSVHSRSKDKQTEAGTTPKGFFETLMGRRGE